MLSDCVLTEHPQRANTSDLLILPRAQVDCQSARCSHRAVAYSLAASAERVLTLRSSTSAFGDEVATHPTGANDRKGEAPTSAARLTRYSPGAAQTLTRVKAAVSWPGIIQPLGGMEAVMEDPTPAPLCPTCSRALEIATSEPHPTRDRVDLLTYRCAIHGDVYTRIVDQIASHVSARGQPQG